MTSRSLELRLATKEKKLWFEADVWFFGGVFSGLFEEGNEVVNLDYAILRFVIPCQQLRHFKD